MLYDGSGLTRENHVTASMLAGVVRYVMITPRASVVQEGFPVCRGLGVPHQPFRRRDLHRGARYRAGQDRHLSLVSTLAGTPSPPMAARWLLRS